MRDIRRMAWAVVLVGVMVSVAGAQPAPGPIEKYIPAGPLLYVHFQGLKGASTTFNGTAMQKILNEPEVMAYRTEVANFLAGLMREKNVPVSWDGIRLLLDCEMAFALMTVDMEPPGMVLVVRPGANAEKVKTMVDSLIQKTLGQAAPENEMDGVKIRELGPMAVMWIGDDLVVVLNRQTAREVIDASRGAAPSFAQDAEYKKMCAKLMPGKDFLRAHWDVQKTLKPRPAPDADQAVRQGAPAAMMKATGLDSVSSLHLVIAPDAPAVKLMIYARTPGGPKGVLRTLPAKPLDEKKMLTQICGDSPNMLIAKCSPVEFFDALVQVATDTGKADDVKKGLAELKDKLGFDIRGELLASLGDEVVMDTVGPGFFILPEFYLSINVTNEAACKGCLDKLVAFIEQQAKPDPDEPRWRRFNRGGVVPERIDYKGRTIVAMKIGMPLPMTPSFALSKGKLIIALLPQTVKKAIDVQDAPRGSFANNADFTAMRAHVAKNPSVLIYGDTKKGFEAVWGMATYFAQMADAIPEVAQSGLTTKLPSSSVITPHLFGTVTAVSYDGEGFLFESAGPFGTGLVFGEGGSSSIGTIGIAAGFLLPAVAKGQDAARRASCMGNTRQLGLALIQYAGDHDDAFPPTLGVLLKDGYLTTTKVFMCPSAARRLPDDFPPGMNFKDADLAVLNKVEELGDYVFVKGITHAADADAVVLYEKDGAHAGEGRNVFFNDGHCKWYPEAGFQRLLKAGLKGE